MRFKTYIFLIIVLLVSSCGEYEKLLKSTDFELKKEKALEYYENEKYVRASELLIQVMPRFRMSGEAENLSWIAANCYYGLRDYITASAAFRNFSDNYPYGEHAEEAAFKTAYCDYLMSPRPGLDQSFTNSGIEGFNYFLKLFPASDRSDDARKLIKELEEKLVEKSYLSARLYYDLKEYKAALVALGSSLKQYPDTKYREELMFLRLESSYLFAVNSVIDKQKERYQDTLDDYYSFKEEFPESEYNRDVKKIYQATAIYLNIEEEIGINN